MNAWTRFQAVFLLGLILFLAAGLGGLIAIWVGVAFAPAAVPVVSPEHAAHIVAAESLLIASSIGLALAARTMVVNEWMGIATTNRINANKAERLHGWLSGPALMAAWASLLVPVYTAALLSVSAWMSLVVAGMVYSCIKGLIMAHAAAVEYIAAKKENPVVKSGRFPWAWLALAIFGLAIGSTVVTVMWPAIQEARAAIVQPVAHELDLVKDQVRSSEEDLPLVEQVYTERIGAETDAVAREVSNMRKGAGSEADVYGARAKLLAAQSEALKVVGEARQALSRLRREEVELANRVKHAESAAPGLAR